MITSYSNRPKKGLTLLLALVLLTLTGLAQAASTWQIQTVDSTGNVGGHGSLALDNNSHPHISYMDQDNLDLKYATWDGSSWQIETVDSEGDVGLTNSLALDSSGYPHISYYDDSNGDLKYATWDGSSWHIETVDSEGDVGLFSSLALDSSGNPHISYFDYRNFELKYATWDGSSWQIETADSEGVVGLHTMLVLDSNDHPHISYTNFVAQDFPNLYLKYAAWDGSNWQLQIVDTDGVGLYNSLALDSSDHPHISYFDSINIDLKYAAWDGSSWQFQTIDKGGWTSLAFDENDHPRISYLDANNLNLKYAAWDGSSWQFQIVDDTENVGVYASLALDSSGNPHISYYDYDNGDLKYAALSTDTTSPVITANVSGTLGNNDWYTGDVTVTWDVSDAESTISDTSGCETTLIDSDTTGTTLTCEATSEGGTASDSVTIQRDATPPTASASVSLTPNSNGWYNTDVTVSFSGSDDTSGIAGCDADVILSSDGAGQSAGGTCTDNAGNVSDPAIADGINIDQTAPAVTVTGVEDGATYILGSVPTAGCDTQDALAGVATLASLTVNGGSSNGVGSFTAICDGASDNAGNTASASVSYSVIYDFGGLTDPIDPQAVNQVKGGQTVPVKFSLNGDQGVDIFAAGYPASQEVVCDGSAPVNEVEEIDTAGNSGLSYDSTADQYNYNWKTDKSWAGTCRQLIVRFDDGSEYSALFQFK